MLNTDRKLQSLLGQVLPAARFTVDHAQHGHDLRPALAQCTTGVDDLPAGGDDILDHDQTLSIDLAALGQPTRAVCLGLLANKQCR